uniref:Uncharacterized protein n=1 Tax=Rhizophagus irregularis (strain DAOM 181602 / DAOM 197198 / MUCL 43194) TaxID=747089 RepID=U9STP6_RHIID
MAQYRAPYERPPFTPPGVLLPMDKPRGMAILLVLPHNVQLATIWLLDHISPMAAPGSEIEKLTTLFIGGISPGVTDDWKKFSII